jgi:hypothetical protein
MRTLLPILLLTPLLVGSTCKVTTANVTVCNSTSSSGGCPPEHPPTAPPAENGAGSPPSFSFDSGPALAAPRFEVSSAGVRPAAAIPEPTGALAFGLACVLVAARLRSAAPPRRRR